MVWPSRSRRTNALRNRRGDRFARQAQPITESLLRQFHPASAVKNKPRRNIDTAAWSLVKTLFLDSL
jgi:hypothetical protein